ncbi:MAG: SLBB domain-containing protein [bacterium]|nr:MAG: SLBB domain-containing protein [bacterium]
MKIERCRVTAIVACLVLVLGCAVPSYLLGQEIRLRRGDRLELAVPQRQELGRQIVINERGEAYLPIVGDIVLEGMSIAEAEATVLRRLREFYPSVQRLTLTLVGEESRRIIYIHGEVTGPGKYEFEGNPSVWEAIREAGGATSEASLQAVRVIRAEGPGSRTSIVNLQQAIDSGNFTSLPTLRPGDTVIVPENVIPYQGTGAVKVMGEVERPAPYMLTEKKTLVDALLAAGGPTEAANLSKVKIIRLLPDGGTLTMHVDFKRYLNDGDTRHNPIILPNDTVNVPRQSSYVRVIFTDPRFLLGLITAGATLAAILITR